MLHAPGPLTVNCVFIVLLMWRTGNGTGVVRSIYSDVVSNLHGEVVISQPVVDELKFQPGSVEVRFQIGDVEVSFQPGGAEVMFHNDAMVFVDFDVTVGHCDVDLDVDVVFAT